MLVLSLLSDFKVGFHIQLTEPKVSITDIPKSYISK